MVKYKIEFNKNYLKDLKKIPKKETDKGALVSVRRFLENSGVRP